MSKHRRRHGDGSIRQRGKDTWEIKVHSVDAKTGRRIRKFYSFKGAATAARERLNDLAKAARAGALRDEQSLFSTVLDAWEAGLNVSQKTAERYRELAALHIRPHLGALKLQALRTSRIEAFYMDLHAGRGPAGAARPALSARTVGHVHHLVVQACALAERDGITASNPAKNAKRPKVEHTEIEILDAGQVRDVIQKLQGHEPMHRLAALGLATGMRRGELCAVRWKDIDLDRARLCVAQSLEQTKAKEKGGAPVLRFKAPKTRYSARTISLPASIVGELRTHRREQAEERLRLGLGRDADDGLVFRRLDQATGEFRPLVPNSVTTEWRRLVKSLGLPDVSLHAWRHTHASQLIDSGMDVLTISRRLGHSSPSITLNVYAHLFSRKDEGAAAVFEAAFAGAFTGTEADEPSPPERPIGGKLAADPIPLHQGGRSST